MLFDASPAQVPLFAADKAGNQQSEVEITLGFKGVEKRFTVPGQHVQELLDVHGLLQHLQLSGAIRCTSLKVRETQCNNSYIFVWSLHCIVGTNNAMVLCVVPLKIAMDIDSANGVSGS